MFPAEFRYFPGDFLAIYRISWWPSSFLISWHQEYGFALIEIPPTEIIGRIFNKRGRLRALHGRGPRTARSLYRTHKCLLRWKLPLKNNFDKDGRCSARGSLAGMIVHDKIKEGAFVRYMAEVRVLPGLCIVRTSVY